MILVLGAGGLLGRHICKRYPDETVGVTRQECDILDTDRVKWLIQNGYFDAVVNCAGVTSRSPHFSDAKYVVDVNSNAPQRIAAICEEYNTKLIQISTDCVFAGKFGPYYEDSPHVLFDLYGLSKSIGEVKHSPHLTIRTSFVGFPDPTKRGLLHYLYDTGRKGERILGYTNHLWNGLTTLALADYIVDLANSYRYGVVHLYGQVVTKFHLLRLACAAYGWPYEVHAYQTEQNVDRTLKAHNPWAPGAFNLEDMLEEMSRWESRL